MIQAPRAAFEAVRYALKPGGWTAAQAALRDAGTRGEIETPRVHLDETIRWLFRAHDATGRQGVARSYSVRRHRRYQCNGWIPAYPETTGYIIPTLFAAAEALQSPEGAARAVELARWEAEIQMPDGAVRGGTVADPPSPAVFNTGQVLFGWLRTYLANKDESILRAAERAARWLVAAQDADGVWRRGASAFVSHGGHVYNARAAWALAIYGKRFQDSAAIEAARRSADFALSQQNERGWYAENCLTDNDRPLVHTIAYAAQGVLEIGILLEEKRYVDSARRCATSLAAIQEKNGRLAGRYTREWNAAVPWSCLTGVAQMALVWQRLGELDANEAFARAAERAVRYVCSCQKLRVDEPGVRGGVAGSFPIWGGYGSYEYLNWAAKFHCDALLGQVTGKAAGIDG